jgi:hypothetical protein
MFINQNSFLILAALMLAGTSWWAYQGAWAPVRILVLGVMTVVIVVAALWARRAPTADIPEILRGGKPVLVEYYSDF